MRRLQLLALLSAMACATAAAPQGVIDGPLLLAPGASVQFVEVSNPNLAAIITAPGNAALDLSGMLKALEKGDSLSVLFNTHATSAGAMVVNPDGSVSLRTATTPPPTVFLVRAGSFLLGGGVIYIDPKGKVAVQTEQIRKLTADEPAVTGGQERR